jgi:hypothetical protein
MFCARKRLIKAKIGIKYLLSSLDVRVIVIRIETRNEKSIIEYTKIFEF